MQRGDRGNTRGCYGGLILDMSTWVGTIVATNGTSEFWKVAFKHGVQQVVDGVPPFVLVECDVGFDFQASVRLAEALSSALSTTAVGFVVQTTSDVHEIHTFVKGTCVRLLAYNRDDGGWVIVEGEPQLWERAYFFDDGSTTYAETWPDLLSDELSEDDVRRYDEAKRAGNAMSVLPLLHPSSTAPMWRVCESLGIKADESAGRWRKRSFWSCLFRRG